LLRIYYSTPLAPTYLYTLSLHDALPILSSRFPDGKRAIANRRSQFFRDAHSPATPCRGTILPGLQFLGWRISSDARNADERRPFQHRRADAKAFLYPKAVCAIGLLVRRCTSRPVPG